MEQVKFEAGHELEDFSKMFKLIKRKEQKIEKFHSEPIRTGNETEIESKIGMSASGVDLESQILKRKVTRAHFRFCIGLTSGFQSELSKLTRKEERLMTSVLHKANVERSNRLKQQNIQQQQQQQQLLQQQYLQQEKDRNIHLFDLD